MGFDRDQAVRRVATLILERKKLGPPVPVQEMLEEIADVEREDFPTSCLAIVYRTSSARPKVILRKTPSLLARERFTMAHEIGHLILPWQPGTTYCHTDLQIESQVDDDVYYQMEREANQFASELLIPSTWLERMATPVARDGMAALVFEIARVATVSMSAAVLAMNRVQSRSAHFYMELGGRTEYRARSGSGSRQPQDSWSIDAEHQYSALGWTVSTARSNQVRIWAAEAPEMETPILQGTSRDLLADVLDDIASSHEQYDSLRKRIAGIVGQANSSAANATSRDLYAILRTRFAGAMGLDRLVQHRGFDAFLQAKAVELDAKKLG